MWEKAMMNKIGIFTGKQKQHNMQVLTLLYDNEPLSAWELTAKIARIGNRISLHATLNKRLRSLEMKGYVRRKNKKWHLRFKGIIAVLLSQNKPKIWNPKWTEIFRENATATAEQSAPILGIDKAAILDSLRSLGLELADFDAWVNLSRKVKELMENGMVNLDIIRQQTLLAIIITETKTLDQLANLYRKK
jgi:hypothetical protein